MVDVRILGRFKGPRYGVACDACGLRFEPEMREVPDGAGGAVGKFACPNCETEYESYLIDKTGLRMRARRGKSRDDAEVQRLDARLKDHITKGRGRPRPLTRRTTTP